MATATQFETAVEHYLADLRRVRASGGATGERSTYGPLAGLLNTIGGTLRPRCFASASWPIKAPAIPTSASTRRGRCSGAGRARGRRRNVAWSR